MHNSCNKYKLASFFYVKFLNPRHMKIIIVFCLIALGLSACKATKFDSGTYRVASAQKAPGGNSRVLLEGFKKEFVFPTDTLKKGDLVYFVKLQK